MDKELNEIKRWKGMRKKLAGNYSNLPIWGDAIFLYQERLENKYFNPILTLINDGPQKGEGFTILTAQCALIESFAAFEKGLIFNFNKTTGDPKYQYKKSKDLFVNFLLDAVIFENNFWKTSGKTKQPIATLASDFYSDVRCGLMHEARTKNNWHINTDSNVPFNSGKFLKIEKGKISVLRSVLHFSLVKHLQNYSAKLSEDNKDGERLRRFFGRKEICNCN